MAILGVDVGGTFTDAVLLDGGELRTAKVPTAAAGGVGARGGGGGRRRALERFTHGTTIATNALLERRGARRRSSRPRASSTCSTCGARTARTSTGSARDHPEPLVPLERSRRRARADRAGGRARAARPLDSLPDLGDAEAIAVCLLLSFRDPAHERAVVAELRRRHPGLHVVASHESAPEFREYERASTTAADAYLGPLLGPLPAGAGARVRATRAAGAADHALVRRRRLARGGGGARGPRAALRPGRGRRRRGARRRLAGIENALAFDMGGTSTDVCAIVGGEATRSSERLVGGLPIRLPTLDVHTVGAGGGSIVWRDAGGALRVGPESAGAEPGPACYGRGGEGPTVTDANLLLGRLPERLAGGLELDRAAAERALARIGADPEDVIEVVNAEMLAALRVVSVERGLDPRDFALVAFGGAGAAARVRAGGGAGDRDGARAGGGRRPLGARARAERRAARRGALARGPARPGRSCPPRARPTSATPASRSS